MIEYSTRLAEFDDIREIRKLCVLSHVSDGSFLAGDYHQRADEWIKWMLDNPTKNKIILLLADNNIAGIVILGITELDVLSGEKIINCGYLYIYKRYRSFKAIMKLMRDGFKIADSLGFDIMVNRRDDKTDGILNRLGFVPAWKLYRRPANGSRCSL